MVKAFATTSPWLDAPLEPGPEADLYRWLAATAGQPPAHSDGADLAVLQVAFPLTLVFASTTGCAPFPQAAPSHPRPSARRAGRARAASRPAPLSGSSA